MILYIALFSLFFSYQLYDSLYRLQLASYQNESYLKYYFKYFKEKELWLIIFLPLLLFNSTEILVSILVICSLAIRRKNRKKLVFTARVKRLIGLLLVVISIVVSLIYYLGLVNYVYFYLLCLTVNFTVITCNLILSPYEKYLKNNFIKLAKQKISKVDIKIIGITGSYGKTSTKEFLNSLLENYFNVLKTPNSFNTPMGITKVINNNLKESNQYFITEMGARKRYEIKELTDIVKPDLAVLTWIGVQHLDTFKTIDNIIKTKFEIVENLKEGGVAFLNTDCEYIRNYPVADKKIITFGFENADYTAKNIKYTNEGTSFDIYYSDEFLLDVEVKLLGKYNVYNLLVSVAVAHYLGLSLNQIKASTYTIQSVKNRLEIKNNKKLTIIDDSYNSNPLGFLMALTVLGQMYGEKYLITPGMVELGDLCEEEHKKVAGKIDQTVDFIILTGENGLILKQYLNSKNVYLAKDFKDAMDIFHKIYDGREAILLLENDLPDIY